jgi:hypothetical protein
MNRTTRDILIGITCAVAGGAVGSIIAALTTNLSRVALVGVGVLTLVGCALILSGYFVIPELVKRLRTAFEARIVATTIKSVIAELEGHRSSFETDLVDAVTRAVVIELESQVPRQEPQRSPSAILAARKLEMQTNELRRRRELLKEGRILHTRLGNAGRGVEVPNDFAVEIATWEADTADALISEPTFLSDFRKAPWVEAFSATRGKMYDRLGYQLEVLESSILHDP